MFVNLSVCISSSVELFEWLNTHYFPSAIDLIAAESAAQHGRLDVLQ